MSTTTTSATESTAAAVRPIRPSNLTAEQRAAIRAARKERATAALQQAQGGSATEQAASSSSSSSVMSTFFNPKYSRFLWYVGVGAPTILLSWAIYDDTSPPAKLAKAVGLADLIGNYTSQISKPVYDKLLPDWADVSVVVEV